MNLKVDRRSKVDNSRLYVMELWIDGRSEPIYKVGKSSGKDSKKRMLDIAGSYFDKHRVLPRMKIKRDRLVEDVFTKESAMHKMLKEYQYVPVVPFSGSTELFDIDFGILMELYDRVLVDNICGELVKFED